MEIKDLPGLRKFPCCRKNVVMIHERKALLFHDARLFHTATPLSGCPARNRHFWELMEPPKWWQSRSPVSPMTQGRCTQTKGLRKLPFNHVNQRITTIFIYKTRGPTAYISHFCRITFAMCCQDCKLLLG